MRRWVVIAALVPLLALGACTGPDRTPSSSTTTSASATANPSPPGTSTSTSSPATPPAGADYGQRGFDLMRAERLGGLSYGMTRDAVVALLGAPATKSPPTVWGADGLTHDTYDYGPLGVSVDFAGTDAASGTVVSYTVTTASFGATSRGIAVGSTKAAVLAAYGADVDPADPDASTPAQIVAGTFAGGVVFLLDAAGTVTSIFVGASAE